MVSTFTGVSKVRACVVLALLVACGWLLSDESAAAKSV